MADTSPLAHSLAEIYLYLMVSPCESCGSGPLYGGEARGTQTSGSRWTMTVPGRCGACSSTTTATFQLANRPDARGDDQGATVNSTDEPSRIIDVGQWITLFRMISEAAARETDKVQARHLGMEAAQCLDEALRFYNDRNTDLPSRSAVFVETSRQRLAEHPEQFSKRRLLDLRSKLPTVAQMRSALSQRKKRWWSKDV